MNSSKIRNEVRKRVIEVCSIDPTKDLKLPGETFDNSGKTLWVEEFLIGGERRLMTNCRTRVSAFMVQYDFCTPVGSGMNVSEEKAMLVSDAFTGLSFSADGADCLCKSVGITRTEGKEKNSIKVLLTFDVNKPNG